jgi:hypothetical protein
MKFKSLSLTLAALFVAGAATVHSQTLPSDAQASCAVSAAVFNSWFQSGSVSLNGVVNPANSVTFPNVPNCSFYQWSHQMFLWLTSPAPTIYGGGTRIFDSGVFYDVTPPAGDGSRSLVQHRAGIIRPFPLRAAQVGPHGLPVIMDRVGILHEVERPQFSSTGNQLIHDQSGKQIELGKATLGTDGKPVLLDTAGKGIALSSLAGRPLVLNHAITALPVSSSVLQKIMINKLPVFIGSGGSIVPVEQGQSDDGVLQAQTGSLVYYATIVNDVYAYYATGVKDHAISSTSFPTNAAQLAAIVSFAGAHGKTFPDPNALAVEIKSSWVEAAGLPNLSSYITVQATIPVYNKSNPNQWVPSGTKTAQLALVGMHVVGSVNGHPEMVWATFEHTANTPLAAYSYVSTSSGTKTVPQTTGGSWLFSKTNAAAPFNAEHMTLSGANIIPVPPNTISPSNTLRWLPFGTISNPPSNSQVISVNNSVRGMLAGGDIRSNYIMSGATWTIGGASPSGSNQVGTNQLTNSTMETYQQAGSTTIPGTNCFTCHVTNTTTVSHVFPAIKPLF